MKIFTQGIPMDFWDRDNLGPWQGRLKITKKGMKHPSIFWSDLPPRKKWLWHGSKSEDHCCNRILKKFLRSYSLTNFPDFFFIRSEKGWIFRKSTPYLGYFYQKVPKILKWCWKMAEISAFWGWIFFAAPPKLIKSSSITILVVNSMVDM